MLQTTGSKKFVIAVAMVVATLGAVQQASAGLPLCSPHPRPGQRCQPAPANRPPTIRGAPALTVTTGQSYAFKPSASDPEGKTLTFSISNRPAWTSFNKSTGQLTGSPVSAAVGEYIGIGITVSDGHSTTALAPFSVIVNQANRAPKVSGAPATAAREGQVYEFKPTATDADGDTLTFSIINKPVWSTFNAATGILNGTPGTGTVGSYPNIAIRVSDGTKTVSLPTFGIGVQQASMGNATLTWQAPTTRIDGSPLTNLAGYKISYGTVAGSYPNQVRIANPGVTSHVMTNLPAGTYYFVATAYDTNGGESTISGVASKTIS